MSSYTQCRFCTITSVQPLLFRLSMLYTAGFPPVLVSKPSCPDPDTVHLSTTSFSPLLVSIQSKLYTEDIPLSFVSSPSCPDPASCTQQVFHYHLCPIPLVQTQQVVHSRSSTITCVQPLLSRPSKLYTAGLPLSLVSNASCPDPASYTQQVFHYHLCPAPHVQTQQVVHSRSSTIICVQPLCSRPSKLYTAGLPLSLVSNPSCPDPASCTQQVFHYHLCPTPHVQTWHCPVVLHSRISITHV